MLTYPLEIITTILKGSLQIVFMILFWSIAAKDSSVTISTSQIASYVVIITLVSKYTLTNKPEYALYISQLIRTGGFNNYLLKPWSTLKAAYFEIIGQNIVDLVFSICVSIAILIIVPPASFIGLVFFLVFIVLAIILSSIINIILGSIAFHLTDTFGIELLSQYMIRMLSGTFIPLYFFPESVYKVLKFTPFPNLAFTQFVALNSESFNSELIQHFLVGIFWIVVLLIIGLPFWKYSLKKYEAIGL